MKSGEQSTSKESLLSIDNFNEEMVEAIIQNIDILELRNNILSKSIFLEEVIQKLNDLVTVQTHPLYQELTDAIQARETDAFQENLIHYNHFQEVTKRDQTSNTVFYN